MNVKVCLDDKKYNQKPKKDTIIEINNSIHKFETEIPLRELAEETGRYGRTFTPAIFNGTRNTDNFREMQLFLLDFDDGKITYQEVIERSKYFKLPVVYVYETLRSSQKLVKFRVAYLHTVSVSNGDIAQFVLNILYAIFPESDKQCIEVSRMFLGGKNLLYYDETEPSFRVDELAFYYQKDNRETDYKHFSDNQKSILNKNKYIGLTPKSMFDIRTFCSDGSEVVWGLNCFLDSNEEDCENKVINWEKKGNDYLFIIELPEKSQKICFYKNDTISDYHTNKLCKKQEIKVLGKVSKDAFAKKCSLWRAFLLGNHLEHNERFLLATNVRWIKGMEKVFLDTIGMYYDSLADWKYYITYINAHQYNPQSCNHCPYRHQCVHDINIVLTLKGRKRITRLNQEIQYVPIDEGFRCVSEALHQAVRSQDNDIHLIKAQTSIGKTYAYINMLEKWNPSEKPLLIAVPLISLKQEIANKVMSEHVVQILSWEQIDFDRDIKDSVSDLYRTGFYKDAKHLMKLQMKQSDKLWEREKLDEFFKQPEIIEKAEKCIVITHAQLMNLSKEVLNKYEIIIDEDYLFSLLRNTGTIDLDNVQKLLASDLLNQGMKLHEITRMVQDRSIGYTKTITKDYKSYLTKEDMDKWEIHGDINAFLNADVYQRVTEGERVSFQYFRAPVLPEQKIIVMSATLDADIYKAVFKHRKIVEYDIPIVKYKGKLVQYTAYSVSRTAIEEMSRKRNDSVKGLFQTLQGMCEDLEYGITFQKYENFLDMDRMHFGNCIGIDKYKGKNGIIVGTPHMHESCYKLVAYYLGVDVEKCSTNRRTVQHGGYEFKLMTYEDEILRKIQLYFLSSELEQAIGRSRLLREDATVYLFSNFPCFQAELIQDDYLAEKKTGVSVEDTPEVKENM